MAPCKYGSMEGAPKDRAIKGRWEMGLLGYERKNYENRSKEGA